MTDYNTLVNTPDELNTGNVLENKSLYWHPTVYSYDKASNTYTRDVMAQTSAYYIWENGTGTKAFPNGFQMIAGLNPDDPANFPNAIAECVNPHACEKDDCRTENTFFPSTRCDELEVSMSFPTCWDGRLDSDDHVSHVHYTLDGELDGPCPSSHPQRLPQIQFFFRILSYDGGWHTFADGSSVFHADYMSGWDENFLQDVLDNCETDSFAANPNSFCENFLTFRDAPKCTDEDKCDFGDPQLIEKIKAFQPPPLDIKSTVTPEETEILVGNLPRGTCNGEVIPLDGAPTEAPVPDPTAAPVPDPTAAPVPDPTAAPVPDPTAAPIPDPTAAPVPDPTAAPVPDPTAAPVPDPTAAPVVQPTSDEDACEALCWKKFGRCERNSDQRCQTEYEQCEDECVELEDEGEIDSDELHPCIHEWCPADLNTCYRKGDRRCLRKRKRCLRRC